MFKEMKYDHYNLKSMIIMSRLYKSQPKKLIKSLIKKLFYNVFFEIKATSTDNLVSYS